MVDAKRLQDVRDAVRDAVAGETFSGGLVVGPGKFEGETAATLYFYDASMMGCGGDAVYYPGEEGELACEISEVTEEERIVFPWLSEVFVLHFSGSGFVSGETGTAAEADRMREEIEEEVEA